MTTWIDGRRRATIDCRDRGLNYGDGAFETMRVRRGEVRLISFHLERLLHACARLGIEAPDASPLRRELVRRAARHPDAVLKLIVTRGVGGRGYRPSGVERATRIVSLQPMSREDAAGPPRPARARMCEMRVGANPALAGLKTLNRLESVLARAEWRDARIWEGLLRDGDDNIICGTMSNLFLRCGSSLLTPAVDRCGIAGVMRRWVLENAHHVGLRPREVRVRWEDLARADEAFMTNAVVGIVPLSQVLNGRRLVRVRERDAAAELDRILETV